MVRSPFAVGRNAVSIVKSLGVTGGTKARVETELDGVAVAEALGVGSGAGSERLKRLQEAAGKIEEAKGKIVQGEAFGDAEAVASWRLQLERWQGMMIKVLVVMLLERGGLTG